MEGVPGDLQAKYQKIAAEYSKMRAQVSVLRKAVVEEQTRNSELRDILKEREQSLRKAEQEMDSLTFRNQQLTKRVTVLQDELDIMQARPKKGKVKGPGASPNTELTNHVLDEELQKKIAENACLLSMMQDRDSAHEQEVSSLTQHVEKLEHELQQYREVNSDAEQKYKAVIERLEEEKVSLRQAVEVKDRTLEQCSTQLNLMTEQKSQLQMDLGMQLQSATATIAQHLPFVDSRCGDLNELNIPRHDRKQQIYAQHVISQAGLHLRDLTAALSDYHTYSEQRLHAVFSSLSPVNGRFSSYLKENARFLRALEQGYTDFQAGLETENYVSLEVLPSLHKLSDHLAAYTMYLQRLLPYHCLSFEEESSLSTCTEMLQASNAAVLQHTAQLTAHFAKLNTYVKLLALQSKRAFQHPPASQRRFLLELTEVLKALHESMKDLSRAYNQKSNLEHELPTSSDRLRTTDECLVKSIGAMVSATGKLAAVLSDSLAELCRVTGAASKSVISSTGSMHPVVSGFKKRAALYVSSLDQEESPSIPYEDALQEHEEVKSNALSCDSLNEQLTKCRQQATKLEQDKEHWRLEYQLLQLRHCKKVKDLEGQIESLSGTTTPHSDDSHADKLTPMDPATVTNLLGRLATPLGFPAEAEAREQEVKNYLTGRINELVAECQCAETRAGTLAAECQVLQNRLELCLQNKLQAESSLQQVQDLAAKLQEDLQTTTHNYETQLSIMSEHLANMNDKLTVQWDEIDQLKYQMTNKSGRKGKQK
ncbi:Protein phosphatase 1 regulatory subunit 21 [Cryptotermes secundus]|uniref:Protein phosphatase 1 regulatory subunit 21 n=1 Tax=Cryptotermes secundus TaxID=105785 RepID=A0A2J7PR33_9NEOP|nr:protein phosphatase 1 regulatory subunit 21 [Cryptotermes secundus]PNF18775.1 Protein phosphatase 1 regulatory subunit 21 [Cryptotermes secundus]PNF18776.1 Protein phosphatase 1 regulatory subunit 21 [Cryptotermes secundus]